MILILAHHYDVEAAWLADALRHQGRRVLLLWPEALGVDYRITLRLNGDGRHSAEVAFGDDAGPTVDTSDVSYAINRLTYIEPLLWKRADPAERTYAVAEINAFFPAFIRALRCPVSSPVRNGALWVPPGFEAQWLARLRRRGVVPHPLAAAPQTEVLAALAAADPAATWRRIHVDGVLLAPSGHDRRWPDIEDAILAERPDEMLEFIAIRDGAAAPRPLWVTRTPALSCYGDDLVAVLGCRAEARAA